MWEDLEKIYCIQVGVNFKYTPWTEGDLILFIIIINVIEILYLNIENATLESNVV